MSAWSSEVPKEPGWWWVRKIKLSTGEKRIEALLILEYGKLQSGENIKDVQEFLKHELIGIKLEWQRAVPPRED